jgi:hypothetical protein
MFALACLFFAVVLRFVFSLLPFSVFLFPHCSEELVQVRT